MQVKCKTVEGNLLSRNSVKAGRDQKTTHGAISVDSVYEVYGIVMFQEDILYLIIDDYDMTNWYNSELFNIEDSRITRPWHYKFCGYNDRGMTSICGYKELVESNQHYNGLIEREKCDIKIFESANNL